MNGALCYFSGTGNTKWIANKISDYFKENDYNIDFFNIEYKEDFDLENINKYDFLIIGTPVYAGMEPRIVSNFLKKLPKGNNKKCIIYSTQGSNKASAAENISRIINKKGYDVFIQSSIKMTNNYYFAMGKKPTNEYITSTLKEAEVKCKNIVDGFIKGDKLIENTNSFKLGVSKVLSKGFIKILPKLSKNMISKNDCDKCGLCVRNCPRGNITMENGRAVFHSKCMLCLRCIYLCPKNAITYKNKKIYKIQKNIIKALDIK